MKKILAFFLAVCFLMSAFASLSVFAAEGSSVTANGSSVYSDSNEVSAAELVSVFGNLLNPNSIAKSWITSKKKPSVISSLKTCEITVDPASIVYTIDGNATVTPDAAGTVTLTPGKHSVSLSFDFHAAYSFSTLKKVTEGEGDFSTSEKANFTFYLYETTVLTLAKTSFSAVYGDTIDTAALLAEMAPVVTLKDGTPVEVNPGEIKIVEKISKPDAGKHTLTVKYAGKSNGNYTGLAAAEGTATLTVSKATASISVKSSTVAYDGKEHMPEIEVTPANVPYTAITAGIQGDASGFASIYMSEGSGLYNALVFIRDSGDALKWLASLVGIDISGFIVGSEGISLAQLRTLLENVGELSSAMKYVGINFDETQIGGLLNAVIAIEKILPDINVRFYVKNMPKNQGLYVTYAVVSDSNYTTPLDFGFTSISPDFGVSVDWNSAIKEWDGKSYDGFDFAASVTDTDGKKINTELSYKFTGLTYAGKIFSSDSLDNYPTEPGIYTETAYVLYNYIGTESRTFTIDRRETAVKFVAEDGSLSDSVSIDMKYNGSPAAVNAVVVDENGTVIEGAKVSYSYSGKTFSGKTYLSSSAPSGSGSYTLTASFAGNGVYTASSNKAPISISKKAASITFDNVTSTILKKVDYSSVGYTFEGMTAEEAARIAATLECDGKIHLLIGTHTMDVKIPEDIAEQYDVTVNGGKHTVKLFG